MLPNYRNFLLSFLIISSFVFLLVVSSVTSLEGAELGTERLRISTPDTVWFNGRDTTALSVKLKLESGWHINTDDPVKDYLIPTELTLSESPPDVLDVQYPDGKYYSFAFSTEEILVYSDTTVLNVTLQIDSESLVKKPHAYVRKWEIRYQPCSDHQCLRPKTVRVPVQFQLGEHNS